MTKLDVALEDADIAYAGATYAALAAFIRNLSWMPTAEAIYVRDQTVAAARAKRRKARREAIEYCSIEDYRLYLNRPLRTEAQARADQAYEE